MCYSLYLSTSSPEDLTTDLGFTEPLDWSPEEPDSVHAAAELYRVIQALIAAGEQVDCLDVWSDARSDHVKEMVVTFGAISEKEFLLFENHHFVFEQRCSCPFAIGKAFGLAAATQNPRDSP